MDFMKWINSLDELLFEVTSWLLFFPLVLWRSLVRPIATMAEAERQLALPESEQYGAGLSPPLFLALALLASHGVSAALGQVDELVASQHGMAALIRDDSSALLLRVIVFAAFPVFTAARLVRRSGLPLDRATLRGPFFSQCHPTAVFALGLGIGTSLDTMTGSPAIIAGRVLIGLTIVNYLVQETRWFVAKLGIGTLRAIGAVLFGFAQGVALLILVGWLLSR